MEGVYAIIVGADRYIGSSTDIAQRWSEHKSQLRDGKHSNYKLAKAWASKVAFRFEVLEIVVEGSLEEAEQNWLDRTSNTLNIALFVGATMRGRTHTPEARAKMSAVRIGLRPGPETRARLSVAHKGNRSRTGKKNSPEMCAKIIASLAGNSRAVGHKHSEEVRSVISKAHKGKPKSAEHRAKLAEVLKKARASK